MIPVVILLLAAGCGTTTQRLATEQLLMSDAVDEAVDQIDFSALQNQTVFLDTTYIKPVEGIGFVNSEYIISSLRQKLTTAQCLIQDNKEEADIIVEPRVGTLGTNGNEVTYGLPQTSAISTASAAIAHTPALPAIPEISVGRSDAHSAIAKIIVYAFERESKRPVWQSGIAKAESNSNNTWILGAGPIQRGTIYDNVRFAGKTLKKPADETSNQPAQPNISYGFEHVFSIPEPSPVPDPDVHDRDEVVESEGVIDPAVQKASHEETDGQN
jgi:hypothetical protein